MHLRIKIFYILNFGNLVTLNWDLLNDIIFNLNFEEYLLGKNSDDLCRQQVQIHYMKEGKSAW